MRYIVFFCLFLFQSCFTFAAPGKSYVIQNNVNGYFTLNGYDFPYPKEELTFPIDLGDKLEVVAEEFIYLDGDANSYFVTMLLKSHITNRSQYFTSRVINNNDYETILDVREISRDIKRLYFGKEENFLSYLVSVQYEIELAGASNYILTQQFHCEIESIDEEKKMLKTLIIEPGDLIAFGQGKFSNFDQKTEYNFTPKIYDSKNMPRIGNLKLEGAKRKSNYKESRYQSGEFEIYKKANVYTNDTLGGDHRYRDVIFFKDFGKGTYFHFDQNTKVNLSNNTVLKYVGCRIAHGTRYYKFKQGENEVEFYDHRYPYVYSLHVRPNYIENFIDEY